MSRTMARALGLAALGYAQSATAQDVTLKPLADARLRYEHVDQDGIADKADAVTLRIRSGVQASTGPWTALVESEATIGIGNHYNDGFNGRPLPLVLDPQNIELNRAQIRYAAHKTSVTVGRQVLDLADQRFVGPAPWRQNEQTFDAVRVAWAGIPRLTIDASYVWSVRTVNGIDGTGARPTAVPGSNWFGLVSYAAPIGTLTGFAYLVDQDLAALQGYRLSSQSYGVRFAGSQPVAPGWKLGYIASAARQSDYRRNPNRYAANYYLAEASLTGKVLAATAGYEVLGADHGTALTSFQTPLASLFRFQGWAGKFGTTPPNGIRDLYGTLGANWKMKGPISGIGFVATWHHFESDRLSQHYGDEIDLLAQAKLHRFTVAARLARYKADWFQTDTTKGFLSVEWVL
ncbi:alginate export family protein [Sphingomonas sp. QA11]|uniref:alginate export family protein n=1 Tax=Sphingomonas sp. QA11 TaxID=2950605 RepID=UPI00234949A1|nr:alginate export family protein [Sphingomonas sp. QA11]WCM28343.1 alginate export family protein [Sphingomonas sp. QA11]